jgi:hypothetical protein
MRIGISNAKSLSSLTRLLETILGRLSLIDNFESFEVQDIEITSGNEVTIGNKLTTIPSKYILVGQTGNGVISKGDTQWTAKYLYIKNNGPDTVKVSIVFMR